MLKWYDSICALGKVEQPRGGEPRIGVNVSYSEVPVTETFLSEGDALKKVCICIDFWATFSGA